MKRGYVIPIIVCVALAGLWWLSEYQKQQKSYDEFIAKWDKEFAEEDAKREVELDKFAERFLDKEFISNELGFGLRYPSTAYDTACKQSVPVAINRLNDSIEFIHAPLPTQSKCSQGTFIGEIEIYPAKTKSEMLKIAKTQFGDCVVNEVSEDSKSPGVFNIEIEQRVQEYSNDCNEDLRWSKKRGILLRNSLGVTHGGDFVWRLLVDGSVKGGLEYNVSRSIQFL